MNPRRLVPALLATLLLGGCAVDSYERIQANAIAITKDYADATKKKLASSSEADVIEAAKQTLANTLKDPLSAQFRNVRLVDYAGGKVVCGEVNAKNSYGGYVGFKRFVASPIGSTMIDTANPNRLDLASYAGIDAACKP